MAQKRSFTTEQARFDHFLLPVIKQFTTVSMSNDRAFTFVLFFVNFKLVTPTPFHSRSTDSKIIFMFFARLYIINKILSVSKSKK